MRLKCTSNGDMLKFATLVFGSLYYILTQTLLLQDWNLQPFVSLLISRLCAAATER